MSIEQEMRQVDPLVDYPSMLDCFQWATSQRLRAYRTQSRIQADVNRLAERGVTQGRLQEAFVKAIERAGDPEGAYRYAMAVLFGEAKRKQAAVVPERVQQLREQHGAPQSHARWTPAEELVLRRRVAQGLDLVSIAEVHQRTTSAIFSRIEKLYHQSDPALVERYRTEHDTPRPVRTDA